MKNSTQNSFYKRHERLINWCSIVIAFALGFGIFYQFIWEEMTEQEYALYEEVAYDIYNQMLEQPLLYEVPEGISVTITNTDITLQPYGNRFGKVKATLKNGQLIVERIRSSNVARSILCILIGIIFICIDMLVLIGINKNKPRLFK